MRLRGTGASASSNYIDCLHSHLFLSLSPTFSLSIYLALPIYLSLSPARPPPRPLCLLSFFLYISLSLFNSLSSFLSLYCLHFQVNLVMLSLYIPFLMISKFLHHPFSLAVSFFKCLSIVFSLSLLTFGVSHSFFLLISLLRTQLYSALICTFSHATCILFPLHCISVS